MVEFNVPDSYPNGTIKHPPPQDQYPVDPSSIQFLFSAVVGQDWCQFCAFNNPTTGLSPLEAQGASYNLADSVPAADGSTLRMAGYGVDELPPGSTGGFNQYSQTQQTHTGPYQQKVGTVVSYVIDTMGGNSGSAVEHLGSALVYAVHTNIGCTATGGANAGTAIDHPGLQIALACPQGVCGDCNGNGILDQCDINCASPCGGCYVPGCGGSSDCNSNGIPDECDIASGTNPDCNNNGVPDECDIASGTSEDCEPNGVPDECEPRGACCLGSTCSINSESCCVSQSGTFTCVGSTCQDSNANAIADVCESPVGACCVGGACTLESELCCSSQGGVFIGAGVTCDVCNVCEEKGLRACCPPWGQCILWTEECCSAVGGYYYPNKNKCLDVYCAFMAPEPGP